MTSPLDGLDGQRILVVVLPQLGEFDSSEFCEQLVSVKAELDEAKINLRVIGIGDTAAAERFCDFTGLTPDSLLVDPDATLHEELGLHAGPDWSIPDGVSDGLLSFLLSTLPGGAPKDQGKLRPVATAWLNCESHCTVESHCTNAPAAAGDTTYTALTTRRAVRSDLAMCAGLGAPGTLQEIFRGYVGDSSAPERLASDATVKAGFVEIGPGVGPVKLGPISYVNWWSDESGYQRPVELATVRLRNMVEVLSKWDLYVTNPTTIARRGATYIFDEDGSTLCNGHWRPNQRRASSRSPRCHPTTREPCSANR